MENYKLNSDRSKEKKQKKDAVPEKKIEKVVTGTARSKKKTGLARLTNALFNRDPGSVGNYILVDILLPALKRAADDTITYAKDMYLYGESRGGRSRNTPASRVSYRPYYEQRNSDRDRRENYYNRARVAYDYDDILFDNRGDAEAVLDRLIEMIEEYDYATVAAFKEMSGVPNENHTDNKYGWTDLSSATPMRTREGYILKLPRAMPID